MSNEYYPEVNQFQTRLSNQIPINQFNSTQDYYAMLRNDQNKVNPEKYDKVVNNDESAYSNYFKQMSSMGFNNGANSNLDKNTFNKAYSDSFNTESNSMMFNQLNNNKFDYNDFIKNFNNSQLGENIPLINLQNDKNNMHGELSGFYNNFNVDNLNKDIISKTETIKQNRNVSMDQIVKINPDQLIHTSNSTLKSDKQNYPRFKTSDSLKNGVSLENIFSGIDENEKG